MRIAIMQPTYLPWAGYFDLMDQVDCFMLLDDVQFSRQSWQQRNRIKTREGSQWLTIPVIRSGACEKSILEVEIDNRKPWRRKHRAAILQNYSRAPWQQETVELLDKIYQRDSLTLADLTIYIIEELKKQLNINTPLVRTSNYTVKGDRVDRLATLCSSLGGSEYVSPAGAFGYLAEGLEMEKSGIRVSYHNYQPQCYSQLYPPFLPRLSVLDLLLNEGPKSMEIIREGRRLCLTPAELADQQHDKNTGEKK